MKRCKGSTIATWDCYTIIPLFDCNQRKINLLPRFPLLPEFFSLDRVLERYNEPIKSFIRKLCVKKNSSDYFVASVLVALYFLTDETTADVWMNRNRSSDGASDGDSDHFPSSLLSQSWTLINDKLSFGDWKSLLVKVLQHIHIVAREHPLIAYAREFIPYMSISELEDVVTILKLTTKVRSTIGLQNIVQQCCRDETAPTFVVFPSLNSCMEHSSGRWNGPSSGITDIKHSCLPTAQLELYDSNVISLIAQFDMKSDDDVSICYVTDNTVEERDKMMQCRIGESCLCARCRFELAAEQSDCDIEDNASMNISYTDLVRIGQYLMIKEEWYTAKHVFRTALHKALSDACDDSILPDIYHALGAIELSEGNFILAQQIWKDAYHDYRELCSNHDGIALQLDKITSYAYFDNDSCICAADIAWESPAPNCFVASVLSSETCQKIIQWAETLGKWTTKRHYAVPTYDVPIHTVPPLLRWFQEDFMNPIIQCLLAKQFKPTTEGRFYVHDAFCVRYESNAVANHLPIHTDESTHSLVVALNDDFDGGGTYFPDYDMLLRPSKGSVVSFRGDILPHGGQAVTTGKRYILAVFLFYDVRSRNSSDKQPLAAKRNLPELKRQLQKPKQQKTDFSFNFDC